MARCVPTLSNYFLGGIKVPAFYRAPIKLKKSNLPSTCVTEIMKINARESGIYLVDYQLCDVRSGLLVVCLKRLVAQNAFVSSAVALCYRQEKRHVEEELYRWGVLRYGWREEDLEGVPGVKVTLPLLGLR